MNKKLFFVFFVFTSFSVVLCGQAPPCPVTYTCTTYTCTPLPSPPNGDQNWQLQTNLSDEFNEPVGTFTSYVASTNLSCTNCVWADYNSLSSSCTSYAHETSNANIVSYTPSCCATPMSVLDIEVTGSSSPWYSSGISSQAVYRYGYYEMSAQLPGGWVSSLPAGSGYYPTFWTSFHQQGNNGIWAQLHNEIDILEPSGDQYLGEYNVYGYWSEHPPYNTYKPIQGKLTYPFNYSYNDALFTCFHKYAVEYYPDRLIFYFDDKPISAIYNEPFLPLPAVNAFMSVYISLGMGSQTCVLSLTGSSHMYVDYFRYSKLIFNCSTTAILRTDNTALDYPVTGYVYQVYSDIIFGDATNPCSINLTSADNPTLGIDTYYFRASNSFSITGNFTAPSGCTFALIPTPCND